MKRNVIHYIVTASPVGPLLLGSNSSHLLYVGFSHSLPQNSLFSALPHIDNGYNPILMQAEAELKEYFAGQRTNFDVPISFSATTFREEVWQELLHIPYGCTVSYGEIARQVGGSNKARAVGGAVHHNPLSIIVPCHRVIGADGSLTGFGGGLPIKRQLLELEAGYSA